MPGNGRGGKGATSAHPVGEGLPAVPQLLAGEASSRTIKELRPPGPKGPRRTPQLVCAATSGESEGETTPPKEYCRHCTKCQLHSQKMAYCNLLILLPFQCISIDILGPLLKSSISWSSLMT